MNRAEMERHERRPGAQTPEEWSAVMATLGQAPYRARQVFGWIHRQGVYEPGAMRNLPASLRSELASMGLAAPLVVAEVRRSRDGTRKLLLDLARGGRVECVLIPMTDDLQTGPEDADAAAVDEDPSDAQGRRATLCISTQIGCAMGCVFCASGQAGLRRGLGADEIVAQVALARRYLDPAENLRNLVFMGMGEPLHHYDETARAIRLLSHEQGLAMSLRRMTVSTVGLVPGIKRLGEDFDGKIGLALSLHAPTNELRDAIMPMNRRYPLEQLIQSLKGYPLPRRRRITIEYILIAGTNDRTEDAARLAKLLRPLRVKINLIPMNPIARSELAAPAPERVEAFRSTLAQAGYSCSVRRRRGDDVDAACGQLALTSQLVRSSG